MSCIHRGESHEGQTPCPVPLRAQAPMTFMDRVASIRRSVARLLHRCTRSKFTFLRHLSEQANLYVCACGREYATNHSVGGTLLYDDEMRWFYASLPHCYPPCTGPCCQ